MKYPIPADVPKSKQKEFLKNYKLITKRTGRFMIFAGDQKIEHLNDDFFGKNISDDDHDPEHLFKIASKATIGCFAAQYGLISRYGKKYKSIPYLIKLNSKTNLSKQDPLSLQLNTISDVMDLKKQGIKVAAVGYTIYLGSKYESQMLKEAAHIVHEAHKQGLLVILWMYPRGKSIKNEKDPHLIAGAAGVACSLGADVAKVNFPKGRNAYEKFKEAVESAGNTKLVCAGGHSTNPKLFLKALHKQIHISGCSGSATGRNIHQKMEETAIRMCNAISSIVFGEKDEGFAIEVYNGFRY